MNALKLCLIAVGALLLLSCNQEDLPDQTATVGKVYQGHFFYGIIAKGHGAFSIRLVDSAGQLVSNFDDVPVDGEMDLNNQPPISITQGGGELRVKNLYTSGNVIVKVYVE